MLSGQGNLLLIFGARKMQSIVLAFGVIWNKSLTNLVPVLRKATKYLSAETGNFSESEIEIGRKSKIQIQEKPSMIK